MAGLVVTEGRVGLTVRQVSRAADKKVKNVEVILPVDPRRQCVIVERDLRRTLNVLVGRRVNNTNEDIFRFLSK